MEKLGEALKQFFTKFTASIFALMFVASSASISKAQETGTDTSETVNDGDPAENVPMIDWQRRQNAEAKLETYGFDVLGDSIDPHTGSLTFQHTDVNISGNFPLEVAVHRRRSQGYKYQADSHVDFGDWELLVPRIQLTMYGRSWPTDICTDSYVNNFPSTTIGGSIQVESKVYANGLTVQIPGQKDQQILELSASSTLDNQATHFTKENWWFKCITANIGDGFEGHAPNGDIYKFDHYHTALSDGVATFGGVERDRTIHTLAATRVTDVNNNYVSYNYSANGALNSIVGSDNRRIEFEYSNIHPRLITKVSAINRPTSLYNEPVPDRHWNYTYRNTDSVAYTQETWRRENYRDPPSGSVLSQVTQPDGKSWTFYLDDMSARGRPTKYCTLQRNLTASLLHPYGLKGEFALRDKFHRQTLGAGTPSGTTCPNFEPGSPGFQPKIVYTEGSYVAGTVSVIRKEIMSSSSADNPIPGSVWTYEYEEDDGSNPSNSFEKECPPNTNWTVINGPDSVTEYCHRWVGFGSAQNLDGVMLKNRTLKNGSVLQEQTFSFLAQQSPPAASSGNIAASGYPGELRPSPLQTKSVTKRQNNIYTSETLYNTDGSSPSYSYRYPVQQLSYSNVDTKPRVTKTTYNHNITEWVLGLPTRIEVGEASSDCINSTGQSDCESSVANFRVMSDRVYDYRGRKIRDDSYGSPLKTYGYHGDNRETYKGAPYWVGTGSGSEARYSYALGWENGAPARIRRADGRSVYQYMDSNGWMYSSWDAKGRETTYEYDPMGRLTRYIPPKISKTWHNTDIEYNFGDAITQEIIRGDAKTTVTYDNLMRPVLVKTQDTSTSTPWVSYVNTEYDNAGRTAFESYPSSSVNSTSGVNTLYDVFDRPVSQKETVTPYAETKYRYGSGHKTTVTDPNGFETVTYYYGYDGTDHTDTKFIEQEISKTGASREARFVKTNTDRNIWGEITQLRQSGKHGGYNLNKSMQYYYNASGLLCRFSSNMHGDTLYNYNLNNELIAYNQNEPAGTNCATPSQSGRVDLTRDLLGRVTFTDFEGASTDDYYTQYDDNGNKTHALRAGANWRYTYDELNNLVKEEFFIDGRAYKTDYQYNNSQHIDRAILPSGRYVNYTLDGLGRTRSIDYSDSQYGALTNIASGIDYHPSGQIENMDYYNGLKYTQTFTPRLKPLRMLTRMGTSGSKVVDLNYGYSPRGQISSKNDGVANLDKNFTYDGLGRLTLQTIPMGGSIDHKAFAYDTLGNIRSKTFYDVPSVNTPGASGGGSGSGTNTGLATIYREITASYDNAKNRLVNVTDTAPDPERAANSDRDLSYDTRGNVIQYGDLTFTYDLNNQPWYVLGSADFPVYDTYRFDGNGKRARASLSTSGFGAGPTAYYIYNMAGQLTHVDNTIGKQTDYIHLGAGGTGKTVARIASDGATPEVTYLHHDHLGSAVAGTDENGMTLWTEDYTPYGINTDPAPDNALLDGFTGHVRDATTGLNYMQARFYDPVVGRFLSVDPVDFIGSGGNPAYFNRYAYSGNDPINNIDPDGEFFQVVGFALGVASNVAIQTLVEGKSLGEVNVVEALTSGAVGATGLGAVSQGAKAIKAVRGAKQVSKNLKKAQRHAQSRSRRGKDSFNADKKVNSLQNEIRGDIKDAGEAVGKAVGAAIGKKVIDETVPEVTVNDVGQAIGSAAQAVTDNFDKALENEVNR